MYKSNNEVKIPLKWLESFPEKSQQKVHDDGHEKALNPFLFASPAAIKRREDIVNHGVASRKTSVKVLHTSRSKRCERKIGEGVAVEEEVAPRLCDPPATDDLK